MNYLDLLQLKLSFKNVFEQVNNIENSKTNNIYLSECATNLSKLLACYLFKEKNESIIYVTPSIYEASKTYEVLCEIIGTDNVSFFPVEEFISSEIIATSESFRLARMLCLNHIIENIPQIIVTNVEGLIHEIISKEELKKSIIKIKSTDQISRDMLIHDLIIRGYKKTKICSSTGTFSVRGSLIDVYPINEDTPIRIYFFDDEIENIKRINSETQLSIESIKEVDIYPLYEIYYEEKKIPNIVEQIKKNNEVTEKIQYDINSIETYQNLDQLYTYLPYLCDNYNPFYELVSDKIVIYEDYFLCLEHEKSVSVEISDYLIHNKRKIEKGFFKTLSDAMYYSKFNIFTSLFSQGLPHISLDFHKSLNSTNCFEYNNNIRSMIEDIKLNKNKTYLITHIDDKKLRFIEETFESHGVEYKKIDSINEINSSGTYITVMENGFGFEDIEKRFEIITPNEFAPGKIVKNSKFQKFLKESTKIYNKDELNPGDYVVHQEYGIGKYIGILSKEVRGHINDYLGIEYSGESKLYVPVENIYVLEKYIGSKDKLPKLNSLNSNEWKRKKEKVKEKTREIAKQLIKVQAQRDTLVGFKYNEDSLEQIEFENDFQFKETIDQKKAIDEVKKDMEGSKPVDRLICGDVGFGKTEIAMRAAFKAVDNNKQVAYLAPTTVLTRQHYYSFKERFEKYGVRVELLNRFVSPAQQNVILEGLKKGYVDIVIGTHRILSKDIKFKDLGLLIVDEEQRFGVEHKERIKNMKSLVDVLTLSATPIPRTLQLALSGLRDLSLIETAPNNRLPIQTYVLESNDSVIREAINREMGRGGQVFYLLNRITELERVRTKLHKLVPNAKIGLIHGKMDKDDIENELMKFLDRYYDVLICTTIIETGIDIPNANTLIIERADILGLSQLYQIRGRVGRSDRLSYAYLMYDKNKIITQDAKKRLEAIKEFTELGSGYKIAMRDLAIRGSGDILGNEQSGYIDAVGMDLYMKLLNEAILEEKGLAAPEANIRKYQIDVSRHVDENYVSDDSIRIEMHQSISKIKSREQICELKKEYIDRYGKLNSEIEIYMEEKYLEYLLKKLGVESFKDDPEQVIVTFDEQTSSRINASKLFDLSIELNLKYRFDYQKKRIIFKIKPKDYQTSYIFGLNIFLENILKKVIKPV